jgi:lipoprotein-anchoring transpeptidase ErfK/SrfK
MGLGLVGITIAAAIGGAACKKGGAQASPSASAAGSSSAPHPLAAAPPPDQGKNSVAEAAPTGKPLLGITSFAAIVYKEPRDTSKRIGYLRVGAKVARSEEPVSTKGCEGGWYQIFPRGYVCAGKEATTNLDDPILAAASKRPNLAAAMPYRYGFVRAVLPLYLKVPSAAEQEKSEFKLKEHLDWYEENRKEVDKVSLGAWDVPLDSRGVPLPGKELGELGQQKNSQEVGLGILFGGETDDDPIPAWLAGGKRAIPNISDFAVPEYAVFADRARRFTGLGLLGSFKAGDDAFGRRFAITTDLRLAPTTKLKPDSGSPWHGFEISDQSELPLAFVREQGAVRYSLSGESAHRGDELAFRSAVKLSGKQKKVEGERYLATRDGDWVRASDVGVVVAPRSFPKAGEDGEKWVEVSLSQQTLVLWEGKHAVYATLVSTGRKTFETITGEFRIRNKHITATMDSDEKSEMGGSAAPKQTASRSEGGASRPKTGDTKPAAKPASKPKAAAEKKPASPADAAKIPHKGDGEYGVTRRRGEGLYALKDVPYIQYFASGYALHAAYWHDVFGKQKSHGCVNLSPIDAHRVFMWTEPAVPEGWHGINTGEEMGEGTTVIVHD